MGDMINFGIDLGTTNSLVAKFTRGTVEVFKNPVGFNETLPSVVGFRNDRILVGEKARDYAEKDAKSVFARFKRRMGTTESFRVKATGQSTTPVELSAFVLKELKRFIHTGEVPESVVITIPASFDMLQSNATKEAGLAAGFKQVVLLQEPIAASLAYANKEKSIDLKNSQWIVYDLGGGTFDVALVKIVEGELKIVDHEGDNFLGGADFDALIVENLVVPRLEDLGVFDDLLQQMRSETGRLNMLWYSLLRRAEIAKIELSNRTSTEIEVSVEDDDGEILTDEVQITRSEYEALIRDCIGSTAEMLKKILTRNSLRAQDVQFVLMVGGSTYTPFVRKHIEELLGIPVNTRIDPTNAIAIGAAYFAATKEVTLGDSSAPSRAKPGTLKIKAAYNRTSQDLEEVFAAKIEGQMSPLFYRIQRDDGGYDSGLKQLGSRIHEDLPLQEDAYNLFSFRVLDGHNNPVATDFDSIQIAQGKYSVAGQPLPEDLSLVYDYGEEGDTRLERVFGRKTILPARCSVTREASKTLVHGTDDAIKIIVVEGPTSNHFTANKIVGHLVIRAENIKRDIIRGTDIELKFEVSESRDLTVTAYVSSVGQEWSEVFEGMKCDVPISTLKDEVEQLDVLVEQEQVEAIESERFEAARDLGKLRRPVEELRDAAMLLDLHDVTDDRLKLEVQKRKLAQQLSELTAGKRLEHAQSQYQAVKDEVARIVKESGNDHERKQFYEVVAQEHAFLNSSNPQKIEGFTEQLHAVAGPILRRTPSFLIYWFENLVSKREALNDQLLAKTLIEAGRRHVSAEDFEKLDEVIRRLFSLVPKQDLEGDSVGTRHFTGIR